MGRYTGPKDKLSRRFGVPLFGNTKALEHKNYPPGMHGPKGARRKQSEYSVALAEKQKLRFQYGLLERQFRKYFEIAARKSALPADLQSALDAAPIVLPAWDPMGALAR